MSMPEIPARCQSIFFIWWMGGRGRRKHGRNSLETLNADRASDSSDYPNFEDSSGSRCRLAGLIDIRLSKSISGLPTMGSPKIRSAEL
jgi:hypothetical protein